MRSMTGFSREQTNADWGNLAIELRSVNQRYLDLHFHLAEPLRQLEPAFRERLRGRLQRGKVEITLRYRPDTGEQPLVLDNERLERIAAALAEIRARLPEAAAPTALDLLGWPGVTRDAAPSLAPLEQAALALFERGLSALEEARSREGARLGASIEARLVGIEAQVREVRMLMPVILARQRELLERRAQELEIELDEQRLGAELAALVQKADVAEELDRLDSHVAEVRHQLTADGPIGRRLDFLMQELNREANTLSSKSVVKETTLCAVELKVLIEQMREQVQNLE